MGETQGPVDPIPVTIVNPPARPGVPVQTLSQFLLRNGIIDRAATLSRGSFVENVDISFGIDDVLSPVERETRIDFFTQGAPANVLDVVIEGIAGQVVVIRSLTWLLSFGVVGPVVPDTVDVLFDGRVTDGPGLQLTQTGAVPPSLRIIGDTASDLTRLFHDFLPISLYPGDAITFRQTRAVAGRMGTQLFRWQEIYQLPFRPAGL